MAEAPDEMVRERNGELLPFTAVLGPGGRIYSGYAAPGSEFSDFDIPEQPGVTAQSQDDRNYDLLLNYWTDLPFLLRLASQGTGQGTKIDHCNIMALNAQKLADEAAKLGVKGQTALKAIDSKLSKWYIGRRVDSTATAIQYYKQLRSNDGDLGKMGAELYPTYHGTGGFARKFLDSINPAEDQTHHFVAYFSSGINDVNIATAIHKHLSKSFSVE